MKEYVLILSTAKSSSGEDMAIFISTKKPESQRGKLSLVGGQIETGQSHYLASERKFQTETGLIEYVKHQEYCGTITLEEDGGRRIYLHHFVLDKIRPCNRRNDDNEFAIWKTIPSALDDDKLMKNLKSLIPLMIYKNKTSTIKAYDSKEGLIIKC
jgi:ADP-ribose pyrophosphatase YjhB (NUDIX family)